MLLRLFLERYDDALCGIYEANYVMVVALVIMTMH